MSDSESSEKIMRKVRSYVRREGRLTVGQQRALDELWPQMGIEAEGAVLDFNAVFGRVAPVTLEIGFGMGDSLAEMALNAPEQDFIGIEVHRPGVGRLLAALEEQGSTNVRVFCHDAVEILEQRIPDASLDRVLLFFPDPWHKKRHNKRRIVQQPFLDMLRLKLKPGGIFHMATDWQDYAEWMMIEMNEAQGFENTLGPDQYSPRPDYRPITKFERRGQRLGHGVWDLLFKKVSA